MSIAALVRTKWGAARAQARHVPRALRLARQACGGLTIAWLALLGAQGLLTAATVYLSRPLVDALAHAIATPGDVAAMRAPLLMAAVIGAILIAGEAARALADWLGALQSRRIEDFVSGLVHRKSTSVDVGFYEMPKFHDHLHRARDEARYRPSALLASAGGLLQSALTLAAMAAILVPYGAGVAAALVLSTLPAFFVVLHFAALRHRLHRRTTAEERHGYYYDWLMTSSDVAAEIRVFGIGKRFEEAYRAIRESLRGAHVDVARRQFAAEICAAFATLSIGGVCVGWVAWRAMSGAATLGDVTLFCLVFSQGQKVMRSMLTSVGHAYSNVLFLGNLFEFLDLPNRVTDPQAGRQPSVARASAPELRFEGVTFGYPGSERIALRDLDLVIPAGRISAIVGTNGAGKSTLVKLACRFYDPQRGRVLLDGTDLRDMRLEDLRARLAILFQQPVRYNMTVAENVGLGSASGRAAAESAARAAGADELVARLPAGYETLLGRWFEGGTELSVGEWQRLALARAFARDARLLLLDEPTSAMDSWAEGDWLRRLRENARDRTTVIITHRFTTAMQADVIHVIANGRVSASGSHSQLLARDDAYASSWRMQMGADRESVR